MKILRPTALAALALTLAFAGPLAAQETDAAKDGDAAASGMQMHQMDHGAMGEAGCSCPCMDMKSMHQGMKSDSAGMHGMMGMKGMAGDSAHAGMGMHAGMDSASHAAMMQKHQEMMQNHEQMMENCSCKMGGEGENMQAGMQGMQCSMHGQQGEGMQHQHGMPSDDDAGADGDDSGGR